MSCSSTTDGEVSTAAAAALADFKNTYGSPAVLKAVAALAATLVLGQTSVSDSAGTVTIGTCFAEGESGGTETDAAACRLSNHGVDSSTMKNTEV